MKINFQFENLFWTILIPEWAIAICSKKFLAQKSEIIANILDEDQKELKKGDSFFDIS